MPRSNCADEASGPPLTLDARPVIKPICVFSTGSYTVVCLWLTFFVLSQIFTSFLPTFRCVDFCLQRKVLKLSFCKTLLSFGKQLPTWCISAFVSNLRNLGFSEVVEVVLTSMTILCFLCSPACVFGKWLISPEQQKQSYHHFRFE